MRWSFFFLRAYLHAHPLIAVWIIVRHRRAALVGERLVKEGDGALPHRLDHFGRHAVVDDREEAHLTARAVPLLRNLLLAGRAALEEGF